MNLPRSLDVAIVGAGFGGLYTLHRLRELGFDVRVYEVGSGIGGTWFWNRYPGARCDVENMAYSYAFSPELEQEWDWSERYATQPEILKYANHVADRFDLRRNIQLDTRIESVILDETTGRWCLRTAAGEEISAQFCIIGTGSTAIQAIPPLAIEAGELFVFQRTPNYSMPARNAPMSDEYQASIKADYAAFRKPFLSGLFGLDFNPNDRLAAEASPEERTAEFERRWADGGLGLVGAFADLFVNEDANRSAGEFIRGKIRETVDDPEVAALLCPDTMVGCKRPRADTGYYETYNRSNVHLIDISETPIEEITSRGLITNGQEYELDVIVFATAFRIFSRSQGRAVPRCLPT